MSAADLAGHGYLLLTVTGVWLAVHRGGMHIVGASAFVAVGAYATALLGPGGRGWPLGFAVLAALLLAGITGAFLAIGSARLDTGSLALATWGLVWLSVAILRAFPSWSGGQAGLTRPAPAGVRTRWLGLDLVLQPSAHVAIVAMVVVVVLAAVRTADRGPEAGVLATVRLDPGLARTLGVDVEARRRAILATTAVLCAAGGAGTLILQGVVTPDDVSPLLSIQLFAAALIAGPRWWGPLLGAAALVAIDPVAHRLARLASISVSAASVVVTAFVLLLVIVRTRARGDRVVQAEVRTASRPGSLPVVEVVGPSRLSVEDLAVSFGSLRAVDGVDLEVDAGEIHALIGPNGSGKSTVLRALSGALPSKGAVTVDGSSVATLTESRRVARGIARSPQRDHPVEGVLTQHQVEVPAQVSLGRTFAAMRHLVAAGSVGGDRVRRVARATSALDAVGLSGRHNVVSLHAGDRRLLQVSRVVATGARFLLLDEPAAGMSGPERADLAVTLRQLAERGHGILLVEHDLELVAAAADTVTVLAEGRVIARGSADEVRRHPEVIAVYLGIPRGDQPGV